MDDVIELVRNEAKNKVAGAFFKHIYMMASLRHGRVDTDGSVRPLQIESNDILFAYMIFFHHGRVFRWMDEMECNLRCTAGQLLERIDRISLYLRSGRGFQTLPIGWTQDLPDLFSQYGERFVAWRKASNEYRISLFRSVLADLHRTQESIPASTPADSADRTSVRANISKVQSRLCELQGPAGIADFEARYRNGEYSPENAPPTVDDQNQLAHELLFDPNYQLTQHPRLEQANTRLRAISSMFVEIGADFERQRFSTLLDNGVLTLRRVQGSIQAAIAEAMRREAVTQEQLVQGSPDACKAVHLQMMLSLALDGAPTSMTATTLPETLRFDVPRLNRLRAEFLDIATRASMIATVKFEFRSTPSCPVLAALMGHLCAREVVAGDTDRVIAELGSMMADRPRDVVLDNLRACVDTNDMVHRLM
jgi:hypothetical protein